MGFGRNLETVVFREGRKVFITTGFLQGNAGFLVVDIAKALIEKQREYELLVIAGVDGSPQEDGRAPQVGFKLLLRNTFHESLSTTDFTDYHG